MSNKETGGAPEMEGTPEEQMQSVISVIREKTPGISAEDRDDLIAHVKRVFAETAREKPESAEAPKGEKPEIKPEAKDEARERLIKELVDFWNSFDWDKWETKEEAINGLRQKGWIVSGGTGPYVTEFFVKHPSCEEGFVVPDMRRRYATKGNLAIGAFLWHDQKTNQTMSPGDYQLERELVIKRLIRPAIFNVETSRDLIAHGCESWDDHAAMFIMAGLLQEKKCIKQQGIIEVKE